MRVRLAAAAVAASIAVIGIAAVGSSQVGSTSGSTSVADVSTPAPVATARLLDARSQLLEQVAKEQEAAVADQMRRVREAELAHQDEMRDALGSRAPEATVAPMATLAPVATMPPAPTDSP
jgi:hypothetical protein